MDRTTPGREGGWRPAAAKLEDHTISQSRCLGKGWLLPPFGNEIVRVGIAKPVVVLSRNVSSHTLRDPVEQPLIANDWTCYQHSSRLPAGRSPLLLVNLCSSVRNSTPSDYSRASTFRCRSQSGWAAWIDSTPPFSDR